MGTKFSLKDPNPGVWFVFDENDPKSGRICIRVMNSAKGLEIDKATSKKRTEYRQGQRFEVSDIDDKKRSQLFWDYVIVDWERLEDDDGNPIECTSENKYKLMLENVGFASYVGACIAKMNENYEAQRESVEKN